MFTKINENDIIITSSAIIIDVISNICHIEKKKLDNRRRTMKYPSIVASHVQLMACLYLLWLRYNKHLTDTSLGSGKDFPDMAS